MEVGEEGERIVCVCASCSCSLQIVFLLGAPNASMPPRTRQVRQKPPVDGKKMPEKLSQVTTRRTEANKGGGLSVPSSAALKSKPRLKLQEHSDASVSV